MTSVLFNGKKILCPSCWEEVKVYQYIKILTEWEPEKDIADRDYFQLLNILTDSNFVYQHSIENEITLIDLVGWVVMQPFEFSKELPKVLELDGKMYDVPRETRELSIGQNIHLRREIEKTKTLEASIPMAIAIYMQPIIDKTKFDIARAKEIAEVIKTKPIYLMHPIGFFLLHRALKAGTPFERIWRQMKSSLRKTLNGRRLG